MSTTHASSRASSPSAPSVTPSDFPLPPTTTTPRPMPNIGGVLPDEYPPSISPSSNPPEYASLPFDTLFVRLQSEFTKLSNEQARISAREALLSQREQAIRDVKKELLRVKQAADQQLAAADSQVEKSDRQLERAERERQVTAVQYETAVEMERMTEEKQSKLEDLAEDLERREAELALRLEEVERREVDIQQSTRARDGATLVYVDRTGFEIGRSSNTGIDPAQPPVVPKMSRETPILHPPRGRTLSMTAFAHNTPSPDAAATIRPGGIFIPENVSPLQRRSVLPRRISADELSSAGPTPISVRPGADEIALLSPVSPVVRDFAFPASSVWKRAEGKVAAGRGGSKSSSEGGSTEPPRGRSVRRVSRHENLSSLRKMSG